MSFDCVHAAKVGEPMEWTSAFSTTQHANLVQQWMVRSGTAPLSDEWIPAEWLLRVWDSPAMAAAESGDLGTHARLFEVNAEPVLLGRSIPVVVPELGLAGVNRFEVVREVPNWWLLGPCGREARALLSQFHALDFEDRNVLLPTGVDLGTLRMRALDVVDASRRVGAYAITRAAIGDEGDRFQDHHRLALCAALGFVLKDVWPEAPLLYDPWVERHGLPDLDVAGSQPRDMPYPSEWVL